MHIENRVERTRRASLDPPDLACAENRVDAILGDVLEVSFCGAREVKLTALPPPLTPSNYVCCACLAAIAASVSSLKHAGTGVVVPVATPLATPSQK